MVEENEVYLGDRPLSDLSPIERSRLRAATRAFIKILLGQIDTVQEPEEAN